MKNEVVYAPDGSVTGVRQAWTLDNMGSTFATQGTGEQGRTAGTRARSSRRSRKSMSKSPKDFDYFTVAHVDGKKTELSQPVDYWLEFTDGLLTLHFTLPFKTPAKAQTLSVEMYDPAWFVDFSFAQKDPVKLTNAPAACQLLVLRPGEGGQPPPRVSRAKPSSTAGPGATTARSLPTR